MVVLKPGEFFFGTQGEQLKTLLGSCVAITLWHPEYCIGGMCHYLLPHSSSSIIDRLDGRYADHAVELFVRQVRRHGTRPEDYQVKLFGGGNMFPQLGTSGGDVGRRNIEAAEQLLSMAGFRVSKRHVGLSGHRIIRFDLLTGATWIKWQGT